MLFTAVLNAAVLPMAAFRTALLLTAVIVDNGAPHGNGPREVAPQRGAQDSLAPHSGPPNGASPRDGPREVALQVISLLQHTCRKIKGGAVRCHELRARPPKPGHF